MMTGKPYLVLTKDQHAMFGELVEIIGLIESELISSAERVDSVASQKIKKTPSFGYQGKLWAKAITGRVNDPQIAALIPIAKKEIEDLSEDRNDFVHALFEAPMQEVISNPDIRKLPLHAARQARADLQPIYKASATGRPSFPAWLSK